MIFIIPFNGSFLSIQLAYYYPCQEIQFFLKYKISNNIIPLTVLACLLNKYVCRKRDKQSLRFFKNTNNKGVTMKKISIKKITLAISFVLITGFSTYAMANMGFGSHMGGNIGNGYDMNRSNGYNGYHMGNGNGYGMGGGRHMYNGNHMYGSGQMGSGIYNDGHMFNNGYNRDHNNSYDNDMNKSNNNFKQDYSNNNDRVHKEK